MNREILNTLVWQQVDEYLKLNIGGCEVVAPYFINEMGMELAKALDYVGVEEEKRKRIFEMYKDNKMSYAWYRGKGTPDQIIGATTKLAEKDELDLNNATAEAIREYMMHKGIGVDCSGFVYQVLDYAFGKTGKKVEFWDSLDWNDPGIKNVYRAGSFAFAGKASESVKSDELKSMDLILIRSREGKYKHIALILDDAENKRWVVQSTRDVIPMGVHKTRMVQNNNQIEFGFKSDLGTDWSQLVSENRLEFRRLKCLADVTIK